MIRSILRIGIALALLAAPAAASDRPAAILVYPDVRVGADLDTAIQLTNTSNAPVDVACFYTLAEPHCSGGRDGESCVTQPPSCSGVCVDQYRRLPFRIRATAHQPLAWRAGDGLGEGPLDGEERNGPDGQNNRGTRVPPLDGPIAGVLRCVVVDGDSGAPLPVNALVGQATIARRTAGDAALYRAIGIAARPDAGDGDDALSLGGPNGEYAACPTVNAIEHFFAGSPLTTGTSTAEVGTDIVLVPCRATGADDALVAQILVHNEFAQRFSTSRQITPRLAMPLNNLDTLEGQRSIFSVNVAGTLAGRTQVLGIGSGLHALAFESHLQRGTDARNVAAIEVHRVGARVTGDRIVLPPPACAGDCNHDGEVSIDELITSVGVAIGQTAVGHCRGGDRNGDGAITVDELVAAVGSSLAGCPRGHVLPTPSPSPSPPPVAVPTPAGSGPEITHLGLATADDLPLSPGATDDRGRRVYVRPYGQGFTLVVEARRGRAGSPIGQNTYRPEGEPDLQVLVSRPLGDGDAAVCEGDGARGGVPAMPDLSFDADPATVDAMNDLGCRVYDREAATRPCTRLPVADGDPFGFADRKSSVQFCIPIARAWSFPAGDTTVAVRVRDLQGTFSTVEEMVVRIEE